MSDKKKKFLLPPLFVFHSPSLPPPFCFFPFPLISPPPTKNKKSPISNPKVPNLFLHPLSLDRRRVAEEQPKGQTSPSRSPLHYSQFLSPPLCSIQLWRRNRALLIKLYPEISNLTSDSPPIASFIIRVVCSVGDRKSLIHPEITDKKLKNNDDFVWAIEVPLTGKFIIDVEFLDLKIVPLESLRQSEYCLIFSKRSSKRVLMLAQFQASKRRSQQGGV